MDKKTNYKVWRERFFVVLTVCIVLLFLIILHFWDEATKESAKTIAALVVDMAIAFLGAILYSHYSKESDLEKAKNQNKEIISVIEKQISSIPDMLKHVTPFAPEHVYPASAEPNVDFNRRLNDSIARSKGIYYYFSDRGTYVTKRLAEDIVNHNHNLIIKIFMLDIRDSGVFEARKDYYLTKNGTPNSVWMLDEIIKREKLVILQSIYALSQLQQYRLEIYLHKEIPFIRYEITDDLLVVSFLPMLVNGQQYPPSLIYGKDGEYYNSFLDYSKWLEHSYSRFVLTQNPVNDLIGLGKEAGLTDITPDQIKQQYNNLSSVAKTKKTPQ